MIVAFTAEAEADLETIGDFIARDDPRRAVTFVAELIGCCRGLADFPERFPLLPGHERRGIRRRSFGAYLVFYRIGPERIDILHVLNGARNWEPLLFPD